MAHLTIEQAAGNTQDDADDIRDPVTEIGASIKAGLYEFNGAAEGTTAFGLDGDLFVSTQLCMAPF